MAFKGMKITDGGRCLLAQAQNNKSFTIKCIRIGCGYNVGNITNTVIEPLFDVIPEIKHEDNALFVEADIANSIHDNYYLREIGVIAENSNGAEVLYAYDNSGTDAEFINSQTDGITYEKRLRFIFNISNDININIKINGSVYALQRDLDAHVKDNDNPHKVTKMLIGLGNVDNTSDAEKPISNDTKVALSKKAPLNHTHQIAEIINFPSKVSYFSNDNNYQNEEQVKRLISALVNSAPETLDTLEELANALGNDPNFATTVTKLIGTKAEINHEHTKSDITDFPSSLPANGGNADTIEGKRASDFEPAFEKKTAFNKNFGNTAGTVCQGDDPRLTDARMPINHTHTQSQITDFPKSLPANGGNADTVDGKNVNYLIDYRNFINKPTEFPPSSHKHSKTEITDFPSKLSAFENDIKYQTEEQVKETVNVIDKKLKNQCNQNRIELTNSSYYPVTIGYRNGQVVYLKCSGILEKEVPANAGYVVALSMPAEYCPNVDITAYPNISYAGKNIKVDITTTGKVIFTTPEKLPIGFGLNMHFVYMTGKSNF